MFRSIMLVIGLMILSACSAPTPPATPTTPPTKPQVIITAPASGAQYATGTDVVIQSTSSDAQGISRVELLVDGQAVRSDPTPTGANQPQFQVVQTWKATTSGTHTAIVRATNAMGATSEAALVLMVIEPPKPTVTQAPTAVPPPPPTAASAPTPTRAPAPATAPTVLQYTFTLNEEQFNEVANESLLWYADSANVKLQDGKVTIATNYYPPNVKPSIATVTLTASASNCNLRMSVVGATFGYFSLPMEQQVVLGQTMEQRLKYRLAQQRNYTCVDSITVAGGVMTIKYH